jgi:hypothetical protein
MQIQIGRGFAAFLTKRCREASLNLKFEICILQFAICKPPLFSSQSCNAAFGIP